TLLQQGIELRRKRAGGAQLLSASKQAKKHMDRIREVVAKLRQEEEELLKAREQQSQRAYPVAVVTGPLTAGLGLAMVGAFLLLLRQSLVSRQKAAETLYEHRELLRTTLASIGDAVITTDAQAQVTSLNAVAQTLTGWGQEAVGQPLRAVFKIV